MMEEKLEEFSIDWILRNKIGLGKTPSNKLHFEQIKKKGIKSILNLCTEEESPTLEGAETGEAYGALGGRSTGAPIRVLVHFKPPSSFPREQFTLHLPSNERKELRVGGRHDPVIGPRAAPVVEAVAMLVICDLGIIGGHLEN